MTRHFHSWVYCQYHLKSPQIIHQGQNENVLYLIVMVVTHCLDLSKLTESYTQMGEFDIRYVNYIFTFILYIL